jgi:hypothetical protein
MKGLHILLVALAGTALTVSIAFAQAGQLPKHPGYPAKGVSPVTGQSTANDPGQTNASGAGVSAQSATSHDAASVETASDPNRMRIKKSMGAGRLPDVEGALNRVNVNPTGATSTKIR